MAAFLMDMLNLGIVGCGRVTSMFHVKAIDKVPEFKIVAVSDIDIKRMNSVQKSCSGSKAYDQFSMLLADEKIDAVVINTPPRFHEQMVLDSLEAGKHVLCEKPLSITVAGCHRIMDKMDVTGLVVLPARNYAFTPGLLMMEKMISEDTIGAITGMRVNFGNNLKQYKSVTDFRTQKNNGLIEDVMPHILSVVHPFVGYCDGVDEVNWTCKSFDVCDNMDVTLKTASGVDVQCAMSWTKLVPTFDVEIIGEKGKLSGEFGLEPFTVEVETEAGTKTHKEKGFGWYLDLIQFKHPSFQNQYRHFADLILSNCKPRLTIKDEINILETIEALSAYLES
jgi:predicted dehydrogenase